MAGAQAVISPERYAIHKVEQMRQDMLLGKLLSDQKSDLSDDKDYPSEKWDALVKYDPEISAAAEKLRPHGDAWIDKLGQAYFALEEDRSYLSHIVNKLSEEAEAAAVQQKAKAEQEMALRWARRFSLTVEGEPCNQASLDILRQAEMRGYVLTIDNQGAIAVTKDGRGTTYLRSNSDIERFGRFL
jgi:hypothetical protein